MLGAIYIGLSGMNAYSQGLQTISNNVANLNTLGYKASTASFSDLFSYGGGGLTFNTGSDAQRSGTGVRFNTPKVDFRQGDLRQSNGDLDLAIQGSGFLVLKDGAKTYYTRTGQFSVDGEGFISLQGTRFHLAVLDSSQQAVALNIDAKRTSQPSATTKVAFADNLSVAAATSTVSNIPVYDSSGAQHTWTVKLTPTGPASPGEYQVLVTEGATTVATSTLKFVGGAVDPSTAQITVATTPTGADPLSVVLDFSQGVTNFSAGTSSTLRAADVDGHGVGALTSVSVDEDGQVKLAYSNGESEVLGAVALADFRDPQQLTRVGEGLFQNLKSGESRLLASGRDGIGSLVSKQLEASNVNLSEEFGDLILIQRGFQASSQVVSVANDMLQQLFGIRGQG